MRVRVRWSLLPLDVFLAAATYSFALLLRFNGNVSSEAWSSFRHFLPIAVVVHIVANWLAGLYRPIWRYASVAEARRVLVAAFGSGVVLVAVSFTTARPFPRSVIILGALVAGYFTCGSRLCRPAR